MTKELQATQKKKSLWRRMRRVFRFACRNAFRSIGRNFFRYSTVFAFLAMIIGGFYYTSLQTKQNNEKRLVTDTYILSQVADLGYSFNKVDVANIFRVEDPEKLKKDSIFFSSVEEGDYIIVTRDNMLIYDLKDNTVKGSAKERIAE